MVSPIEVNANGTHNRAKVAGGYCVEIAGLRLQLHTDEPDSIFTLDDASASFRTAFDVAPDVAVRAYHTELNGAAPGELIFDSGALWRMYRAGPDYWLTFTTPYYGELPYKIARFTQDFSSGEVWLHAPYFAGREAVNPLEYPLDELVMLNLLAQGRGAELHSCGLVDENGAGYLFLGHSTAGKTTTAQLWLKHANPTVLSDDRIIVRRTEGEFCMYGTPWHGEGALSTAQSAPLKYMFFLEKGPQAEFFEITPSDAVARLFACSFPTFHNPAGIDFTLGFYEELVQAVPCAVLRFRPDETAVDAVRRRVAAL